MKLHSSRHASPTFPFRFPPNILVQHATCPRRCITHAFITFLSHASATHRHCVRRSSQACYHFLRKTLLALFLAFCFWRLNSRGPRYHKSSSHPRLQEPSDPARAMSRSSSSRQTRHVLCPSCVESSLASACAPPAFSVIGRSKHALARLAWVVALVVVTYGFTQHILTYGISSLSMVGPIDFSRGAKWKLSDTHPIGKNVGIA